MSKFCVNCKGSLVLESGMILPVYLIMLLFLISLVKLSVVYVFADGLAYNAAEYSARAANLFDRAYYYVAEDVSDLEAMNQFFMAAAAANKDNSLGTLLNGIKDGLQKLTDAAGEKLLVDVRLDEFKDNPLFRKDKIEVSKVTFAGGMVEVIIHYKTTIPVPFARKQFVITSRGYERQWIGKW